MKLLTLIRKELTWSRHRLGALLVLLVIVPAVFAYGTLFFEHTLPENTPIAIVDDSGAVTEDDVNIVVAALTFFSDPVEYDSRARAFEALDREQVYAVIDVPPGLDEKGTAVTIDIFIHGSITPYRVPSRALMGILSVNLDQQVPASVDAQRHVVGAEKSLSEYLLPTFVMVVLMLVAFTYLPYNLARERDVLDRLRIETSLDTVIGAKVAFFTPLMTLAVVAGYAVGHVFGYSLQPLSPVLIAIYLLTFLYLAAISVSIMLFTGFSTVGRVCNVAVFFLLVPLSNLAYPAGFFSPWSRTIARHIPVHYSMIIARSHLLKEVAPGAFVGWWWWLVGFTAGTFIVLKLAIEYYEWRQ